MFPNFRPDQIETLDQARETIVLLLNLVEKFKQESDVLKKKVQDLQDEVNRLKGEDGKPDIKANKNSGNSDHSSETERKQPKKRRRRHKKKNIKIDREEKLSVDQSILPEDAEFKGYETVTIQDLIIKTDNVLFLKEKYYSPSLGKTYLAPLPSGYEGEFGPGIRSLIITLYYAAEMTEPKIFEFLENMGTDISKGQISNILIKKNESWHEEKNAIYTSGLQSSVYQHSDDTSTRVNGINQHCHIFCNPYYSAYFTRPRKDRLTLIDILANQLEPKFLLNEGTQTWFALFGVPQWAQTEIAQWQQKKIFTHLEFEELVRDRLDRLNKQQKSRVFEAASLTAYHNQENTPIVQLLISDDAPQFRYITAEQALCWVHEGRHYKKLMPIVDYHRKLLDDFTEKFWVFYRKLRDYRSKPSQKEALILEETFDNLFDTVTGYDDLDKRIAKTKNKKERLLMVLKYPEIPLHNNSAELGARRRVRKRDISFGPRTNDGVESWDTFMTLVATAKKLGISFYDYVFDRVSEAHNIPSLAEIIEQKSSLHTQFTPVF